MRDKLKKIYYKATGLVSRAKLKLRPNSNRTRLQLAQARLNQSAWQAALELAQQVLQNEPQNPQALQVSAAAYHGQGQLSQALAAIETAIRLDPSQPWFYQELGKIQTSMEHYEAAISAFRQAIELDDTVSWFHFHLGELLVKQGDWQGAIVPLQRALQLNPLFAWSYYYLAEAYLNLEDIQTAISTYRKAVLAAPDIAYLQDALAYAQHLQGQEERIQAFIQAAQQAPANGKPRILLLTPYPPFPPKLGAASRMFYEMKALQAKADLAVVFFGFAKGDFRLETDVADLSQLAIAVTLGDRPPRLSDQPNAIHRYSSRRMTQVLSQLSVANFDIVVMDFIYMAQYRHLFPDAFAVLSEHNIESQILRRCADVKPAQQSIQQVASEIDSIQILVEAEAEASQLETYENQLWPEFPLRLVVSSQDQAILDSRVSAGRTIVVNNGINTQEVQLFADNPTPRILFMGTLNYYPNIDGATYLVQEILPHVWRLDPRIECWIAGSEPPTQVYDLAQDSRVKIIASPESMEAVAQQCCVTIVPLRIGGGTRIKILHSMAMGLPVISTSLGCEGLSVVDGEHLMIRDLPQALAEATVELVQDQVLRQQLRQQGRQLVEGKYDWENVFEGAVGQVLEQWHSQGG